MNRQKATAKPEYTQRLLDKQGVWWKQVLDAQAPYRWNLRHLRPGYTLEIGCGVGRNLQHLSGHAIGIDHNRDSVEVARRRGLTALLPEEFMGSSLNAAQGYDSLLAAHVVEHMTLAEAVDLIGRYLPNLKPGGRLILITPQEAGFRSDNTHVEFMDFEKLRQIELALRLRLEQEYSFPFPRIAGRIFTYNEFVSLGRKTGASR